MFGPVRKEEMWFWATLLRTHLQSLGGYEDGESANDIIGMLSVSAEDRGSSQRDD